jgi:amidase
MTTPSPDSSRPNTPPVALSRRELLAIAGSLALTSMVPGCQPAGTPQAAAALTDPIHFSSTRVLADAIRAKRISSEEVARAFLDRIAAVNPKLNAVVLLDREGALARARELDAALAKGDPVGPLHGVPMTIKDSLDTAGMITTGGTTGRRAFVPSNDATVVERLKKAGAVLLGKTNTPELTLSFETDNLIYGKTSNPYDLARTSGGSSGGAAAIVAAGGAPFDIGSDYGGSIRLPSHFCGVAGIKPSAGRVPRTGHIYPFGSIQDAFQQIGPIARYVDDLALLLPIIMGPDFVDPGIVPLPWEDPEHTTIGGLRVAFHTDNGIATPTADIIKTVRAVADSLAVAKAVVTEARPTGIERAMTVGLPLYFWDGGAAIRRLLKDAGTTETTLGGFAQGAPTTGEQIESQVHALDLWRSEMLGFFTNYDVIVCPACASPAVLHGEATATTAFPMFSYTFTYNLTGWPGAVVRAGTSPEGLPIGVQIVARPGREDVALAVAKFVETAHGGFQRPTL